LGGLLILYSGYLALSRDNGTVNEA
jgi:hypothetical protein